MVKADVQTPNKRKSFAKGTPAKKQKLETPQKTPAKPFTPKKPNQSPTGNQQVNKQKSNKKNKPVKTEPDSPKKVPPFTGTGDLKKAKVEKKGKPQNGTSPSPKKNDKKKRRPTFGALIATVKSKAGTKDAEILKNIDEKIKNFTSKPDLSKTAKKKLSLLKRLKAIVETGSAASVQTEKPKKAQTTEKKGAAKAVKAVKKVEAESDDEESEGEEESEEEGAEEEESEEDGVEEEEDEDEEEQEGEDEEEDDDDDESDSDEAPPVQKNSPQKKFELIPKGVELNDLKKTDLVHKGQKRFVLFIGNIPYDTTRQDLVNHFSKAGEIIHVRLPTEKGSNKPRGFGYLEVKDENTYQKCLSMHNSQLKGRRINVLYTQGGKKKGNNRKNEIKVKNMKLHALRKQGKLAGSVKESQKRSFRRNKNKSKKEGENN